MILRITATSATFPSLPRARYPEITRFAVTGRWMRPSDANQSLSTVNRLTP